MAVKETKGDGYALYNGVKLPKLPEWDKETYPYAFICRNSAGTMHTLIVSTVPWGTYDDDTDSIFALANGQYCTYRNLKNNPNWNPHESGAEVSPDSPDRIYFIWANFDVAQESGSVYLSASDPIPLDGMNVIEWDGDTEGLESLSSNCYFVSYNTDLDTTRNVVCTRSDDVTLFELMYEDDGYWALGRNVYYSATPTDDFNLSGIEFRKGSSYHVNLFAYHPIEEPTAPIGFIEYLVNPKYHIGKPFRGFIGWKLAQNGGGGSADGEPALVSSDGYTLQDVNGLNLIPKEGK